MRAEPQRLGIFGGTFSPPHRGHMHAAQVFLSQAKLDRLLIMPASIPPHKKLDFGDDPAVRFAMVRAAFSDLDPKIEVSDFEMRRQGVSYTYQTLEHFAESPENRLYFLCGTDMFLTLGQWREPESIFRNAVIACMARDHDPAAARQILERAEFYRKHFDAGILLLHDEPVEISSSEIRDRLRRGLDVSHLVPESVIRLIREHGLYQEEQQR